MEVKTRKKFSPDDKKNMLKFLVAELRDRNPAAKKPLGLAIWKDAAKRKITGHTYASMQNRFRRLMWKDLETTAACYLSKEDQEYLLREVEWTTTTNPVTPRIDGRRGGDRTKAVDESNEERTDGEESDAQVAGDQSDGSGTSGQNQSAGGKKPTEPNDNAVVLVSDENEANSSVDGIVVDRFKNSQREAVRIGAGMENVDYVPKAKRPKQHLNAKAFFSTDDDIAILSFVLGEWKLSQSETEALKDAVWYVAADKKITEHSAISMRNRFRRTLKSEFEHLNHIPEEMKVQFRRRLNVPNIPSRPTSKTSASQPPHRLVHKSAPTVVTKTKDSEVQAGIYEETEAYKELRVVVEKNRAQPIVEIPRTESQLPRTEVRSILTDMAIDGCFEDNAQFKRFAGMTDEIIALANAYKVPIAEAFRIFRTLDGRSMKKLEEELRLYNGV